MQYPTPDKGRAETYRQKGFWRDQVIGDLFASSVANYPTHLAVRDASGAKLTYRELDERSARVAGYLAAQGIGKGDIVTVCLPNWCDTVVVFMGIIRAGGVVNPVPVAYGTADLAFAIKKCESRALFLPERFRSRDFLAVLDDLRPNIGPDCSVVVLGDAPVSGATLWGQVLAHDPLAQPIEIKADDPLTVLFTSGTESRPKGAVHTHNTVMFGENALATTLGLGAKDVAFMASPISHTTGFMHGVILTLTTGGTLSLLDVFNGDVAAAQMAAHRCTWTMGATPFLADTAAALEATGNSLPDLRYFLCGGAPIPEVLARRATDVGFRVMSVYGATEAPPHTVVFPADPIENAWNTDGRPLPGIEVRIIDENGDDLPTGEVGEELSRGPNAFLGYLGEPELTRRDLKEDGWYHSGDLARLLPDGSLRVVGRKKEIIVRGGQNISVREVEDYLMAHPAVERAAVVGIPHERLGETGCAVLVLRAGQTLSLPEMVAFLKGKGVAMFKLPERLEIWPELPMNPSGKIQKFIIQNRLDETGVENEK